MSQRSGRRRYAFLRSPIWVAGIVLALITIVVFVNLALWQLRRFDERRAVNATIEERTRAEPVLLGTLLATHGNDPEALAHRRVLVDGTFDSAGEVLVIGTTLNGRSGNDVLTPLRTGGDTIGVNRGWVPIDAGGPPVPGAEPPRATVEVVGVLLEGQSRGSLGTPEADGAYDRVGRIDLEALGPQWGGEVLPVYVLLEAHSPAGSELPLPRPPPAPDEGPHLAYAVQWLVFAGVVAIGFPALVYRTAR